MKNLTKILSFIIAVLMIVPLAVVPTSAATDPNLVLTAEEYASSISNCTITGTRITATGSAPSAVYALDGEWSASKLPSKLIATYQVSKTNSVYALSMRIEFILNSETVYSTELSYTRGYKYYSSVADISDYDGYADHVKVTFFTQSVAGDTMYFGGLCFADAANATAMAKAQTENANAIIAKYTEAELDSSSYELDKYMIPYWDTDIIYNEGVYPLLNSNGTMSPTTLMYDIDKVISVRSSTLETEYKEGVDYTVTSDGKLQILTTGSIPCVKYRQHYYTYNASNTYKMLKGGYVRFEEGKGIPSIQLAVTYTVKPGSTWSGYLPSNQGESLPNTRSKLENGENLNIVFFGDSITNGGNSSSCINMEPYADVWTDMFQKELSNVYPSANINCTNGSVSGGGWPDAVNHVYDCIIANNPDLVILALGTNDYQFQWSCSDTLNRMNYVVDTIKEERPDCEIIIVSPMLSNPECFDRNLLYAYRDGYYEKANETEGVVVADITAVHDYLLTRKIYTDMSANNICHLNDCLARVYSRTVLRTILPEEANSTYKGIVLSRLNYIANMSLYFPEQQAEISAIQGDAIVKINNASTTDECRRILRDAKYAAALVKTKNEVIGSQLDYTNLIFSSEVAVNAISSKTNVYVNFNSVEPAAEIKVSVASDPGFVINYPTKNRISADKYKYLVMTYKVSDNNSSSATETQLFFNSGVQTAFTEEHSFKNTPVYNGEYNSVVFDLSNCDWWGGSILKIRIDPFNFANVGDTFYLSSLCLCETEAEANATADRRQQIANGTYQGLISSVVFDSEEALNYIEGVLTEKALGDIDGDSEVTVKDMRHLLKILLGLEEDGSYDFVGADLDCDSEISTKDSRLLQKALLGMVELGTVTVSSGANKTLNTDESCVDIDAEQSRYMTVNADKLSGAQYFAMVYKATGTDSEAEVYFGKDTDTSLSTVETIALDGVWDRMIVKLPDSYDDNRITIDLSGITLSIDSIAFFDTLNYADSFTYDRMWERRSDRIYTDNVVITFSDEMMSRFNSIHSATVENISSSNTLKLTVSADKSDPYTYLDLSDLGISADEYKYVVYKYMNPTSNSAYGLNSEVFFCSGDVTNPTAGCSSLFGVTKDGAYHAHTIDLTGASYWKGSVYGIRLDFFANAQPGDVQYISSITFCKTLRDVEIASR